MVFSDEELLEPCKNILQECLYILHRDGGDLQFLGVKNGVVYVKLLGACSGCASAQTTLKFHLERALREQIDDGLRIENLPGGEAEFKSIK